jgi:hypothetical protein
MTSIARKELSRTEVDGKETIVNEIKHFEFDAVVLELIEDIFDDWEYAQAHGVQGDEEYDIVFIEVDRCIDELDDRILDAEPDGENATMEIKIKTYLEPYRGFTIWL